MKHRKRISHRCGWFKKQDGIYRCGQCGQQDDMAALVAHYTEALRDVPVAD